MNLASSLSFALDEFTGICAVGSLYNAGVEAITAGHSMGIKITGTVYWDKLEYPIAVWAGDHNGVPGTPDADIWLQLGEETMSLSMPVEDRLFDIVPTKALRGVVAAIAQMSAMQESAMDALECAETDYDLTATLEQLKKIASASKTLIEYGGEALLAHSDLMFNCMVDLLGNMTVAESADVHLAFDLAAETLDPETGNKVKVRAGWAKADETSHNYTHCFELNGARCQAHDEAALDRMLAGYPEASQEHYRHTFVHLHQAAHAVGDYAVAKAGEAIAKASTISEPLLHVDRHELTHKVHADVVNELNPFTLEMSGEPGRGGHEHKH
jgi:hypothetical protein